MQTLQRTCLWQIILACSKLEQITLEVSPHTVAGWAPKLVHQIRDAQLLYSMALQLHSVELVSKSAVELFSLWCAPTKVARLHPQALLLWTCTAGDYNVQRAALSTTSELACQRAPATPL